MGRDPEGDRTASGIGVEGRGRDRLKREARRRDVDVRVAELLTIGRRCASQLRDGPPSVEHGGLLYDEHGLPK